MISIFARLRNFLTAPQTGDAAEHLQQSQTALDVLKSERDSLTAQVKKLSDQRLEFLASGDDEPAEKKVIELDAKLDRIAIRRERLDLIEPGLVKKLIDARGAVVKEKWRVWSKEYADLAGDYMKTMRAAGALLHELHAHRAKPGFDDIATEIRSMPIEPYVVINAAALAEYETQMAAIVGTFEARDKYHASVLATRNRVVVPEQYRAPTRYFYTPVRAFSKNAGKSFTSSRELPDHGDGRVFFEMFDSGDVPGGPVRRKILRTEAFRLLVDGKGDLSAPEGERLPEEKAKEFYTEATLPTDAAGKVHVRVFRKSEAGGVKFERGVYDLSPSDAAEIMRRRDGDLEPQALPGEVA